MYFYIDGVDAFLFAGVVVFVGCVSQLVIPLMHRGAFLYLLTNFLGFI